MQYIYIYIGTYLYIFYGHIFYDISFLSFSTQLDIVIFVKRRSNYDTTTNFGYTQCIAGTRTINVTKCGTYTVEVKADIFYSQAYGLYSKHNIICSFRYIRFFEFIKHTL